MSDRDHPTSPTTPDELRPGEIIACRYRVQRCCRRHPLGELYLCRDEARTDIVGLGRRAVCLQRLRGEFADLEVRRRLFETRSSASLGSKVIADILDYGEDHGGRPFVVTAWTDDASLDAVERPLSFVEAVGIVERVAAALEPLHAERLVHGGIEPASVLVDEARELTGLLGFGLAPALDAGADKTRALPLLVSPAYAAPELVIGVPMGPSADVYALGILLWELIFGSVPFAGPTLRVLDSHVNRPLPDRELPFDAPASFEWILRRMLAKSPADRFADAGEVVDQLRPYLRPEPPPVQLELLETPKEVVVDDDDDDDETVVFERVRDSSMVMAELRPSAETPDDEPPPAARGVRRFAVVLATIACLILAALGVHSHAAVRLASVSARVTELMTIVRERPAQSRGAQSRGAQSRGKKLDPVSLGTDYPLRLLRLARPMRP